ncbi:glucosyl transferase [cyanobacterium TDX16]|nr:glucosyl transferase [cyanobacterium TDX16]
MKQVSVVIAVFRCEKYISATVQSVLDQTYKNLEILIIDDESPDRCVAICQQFTDPRIQIIRQRNRGLAGARNTGIRHARGEYIAFLDGDDLWLPSKLEKHVEHLNNSPDVGVSFSRSALIDEKGNRLGTYLMPQLGNIFPECLLCNNPVGNGSAAVLRRETLDAIAFTDNLRGTSETFYFDERFRQAEDVECWLRIAIQTQWQFAGIPEALTLYRVNSGGLSANLLKQLEYLEEVIEKTRSYAPEFISEWEKPAKAYHMRYLARSAVRLKAGASAVQLMHRALATHWGMLLSDPRRTLMTLAAAYLLWLLPTSIYGQIEALAARSMGTWQKNRIHRDREIEVGS